MKPLTLKTLSRKRAIRLAELAFSSKIEHPFVCWGEGEDEGVLFVFVDHAKGILDDEYLKKYGFTHLESRYDYVEIDGSFNCEINGGHTCNMALIYMLIFSWGFIPDFQGTGLFPKSKFEPKTLLDLELIESDSLN